MKLILILGLLVISITVAFISPTHIAEPFIQGVIGAFALAVLFYLFYLVANNLIPNIDKIKTSLKKTKRNVGNIAKTPVDRILDIDNTYYEQALKEVEENTKIQGLWIKAGIITNGSLPLQKTEYIKLRAKQLSEENRK
jgi:hypothetical protein